MNNNFLGAQLRSARFLKGYSIQSLASAVGSSRQYISDLERSLKKPSDEFIDKLALYLEAEPKYFLNQRSDIISQKKIHFRKRKSIAAYIINELTERPKPLALLVESLENFIEFPKVDFPEITNAHTNEEIEKAAEKCRLHWGLGFSGPILNLVTELENAGAIIAYFNNIVEKVDAFSIHHQRPMILLNSLTKENACRMRFSLAHELGHLILHQKTTTEDEKVLEQQANRFAGAFLLPRAGFFNEFSFLTENLSIHWKKLFELKNRWKTSVKAMIHRAYSLGMIDKNKYRYANIFLMKTGQAKNERNDAQIPYEKPKNIESAFELMKNEKPRDLMELIKDFMFSEDYFNKFTTSMGLSVTHQKISYLER